MIEDKVVQLKAPKGFLLMTTAAYDVVQSRGNLLHRLQDQLYGFPWAEVWSYHLGASWWTENRTAYFSHPVEDLEGLGCKAFHWEFSNSDMALARQECVCLVWVIGEDPETIFATFGKGVYLGDWQEGHMLFNMEESWRKDVAQDGLASYRHESYKWTFYADDNEWDYSEDSPQLLEEIKRRTYRKIP